jgi:WD40 repeat protein
MQTKHVLCLYFRWLGLGLLLLVVACTNAPASSHGSPTATGSALPATITTYHRHTSTVFAVAWSPDGTRIASGGNQVWDARTGHLLVKYSGHTGTVYTVVWSPDGRRIASGSDDSTVQVWDAASGKQLLISGSHIPPEWAVACVEKILLANSSNIHHPVGARAAKALAPFW